MISIHSVNLASIPTTDSVTLKRYYAWFQALHAADIKSMSSLISQNIHIDSLHPLRQTTALMEATRLGHTATVEWLLARGAAQALLCGQPKGTALHCALRRKHWEIAMMLLKNMGHAVPIDAYGATFLHALCSTPFSENETPHAREITRILIEKQCPMDALDHEGMTALHHAVLNENAVLVEQLLLGGATPNARTPDTWVTPLMVAAIEKQRDIASLLLRYGADPHHRTRAGATPAGTYTAIMNAK